MSGLGAFEISLPEPSDPLDFNDGVAYLVAPGFRPPIQGETQYTTAAGEYQDGELVVSAVTGPMEFTATIHVLGDTWAEVDEHLADLRAALHQFRFTMTTVANDVETEWLASRARSVERVNGLEAANLAACIDTVRIVVPVQFGSEGS